VTAGYGTASTKIDLVVFDLGRVLVRICDDWTHAAARAGIQLRSESFDPSVQEHLRLLLHAVEVGAISFDDFARQMADAVNLTARDIHVLSEAYIFGPYPGAEQLVTELPQAGVRTACLSNTNEHHWGLLSQAGQRAWFPLDRFNHRFASHLICARKPDKEIYAHLEQATGIEGQSILFFDDVAENVEAARQRGWNGCWIDASVNDPIGQIRNRLRAHQLSR
jgi:putative hydrolase of the HAD superfamily